MEMHGSEISVQLYIDLYTITKNLTLFHRAVMWFNRFKCKHKVKTVKWSPTNGISQIQTQVGIHDGFPAQQESVKLFTLFDFTTK